jgi:exoribonuclease-2
MVEHKFSPDFDGSIAEQLKGLPDQQSALASCGELKDLRSLLWSSIDNDESLDLDQIEYAERLPNGDIRLMVGIADVDAYVKKDSAIDKHAFANTTSVYTGVETFPMLPEQLSCDITSLKQDEDRAAIVIDMTVTPGGEVSNSQVCRALVRNHAKLAYPMVGKWLDGGGKAPNRIAQVPGLVEQLLIQNEARERLHDLHKEHGALNLQTIEARPVATDGKIIDLEVVEPNPARDIIENLMISANIIVSQFLEAKGIPSIRRVVRTPERWPRIVEVARSYGEDLPVEADAQALATFLLKRKAADPVRFPDLSLTIVKLLGAGEYVVQIPGKQDLGHFALAVHDYTHATAPNRRFSDLVTQRLIKAVIAGQPVPYSVDELDAVARQCTEREGESKKVERTMRKVAAAVLLSDHIGEWFEGIVTGVTPGGTYVRLFKPPAEGRVVQGEHGLDVGDKVKLRLLSTDPENAWIDFARAKH